jgi:hypothetical protein
MKCNSALILYVLAVMWLPYGCTFPTGQSANATKVFAEDILFENSSTHGDVRIIRPNNHASKVVSNEDGDFGRLDIQNINTQGNAFSAINFLNTAGNYRFSLGYGNTNFPAYKSRAFLEANNLIGKNAIAPDLVMAQTGTLSNGNYDINIRQILRVVETLSS